MLNKVTLENFLKYLYADNFGLLFNRQRKLFTGFILRPHYFKGNFYENIRH